jgi:uncharacterized protein with NRDE domain
MIFTKTPTTDCGCSTYANSNTVCPNCNRQGININGITIKSQLKKELFNEMKSSIDNFNFCTNAKCDTVYYSCDSNEIFFQKDIKSKVTIKNDNPKTPLCYCRKLLKENVIKMINDGKEDIAAKVKSILSEGKSFCEKSNPKGVCCTEDIKDFLSQFDISWDKPKKGMFSINPPKSSCC